MIKILTFREGRKRRGREEKARGAERESNCANFSTARVQLTSPLFFAPFVRFLGSDPASLLALCLPPPDFYDSARGKIAFFTSRSTSSLRVVVHLRLIVHFLPRLLSFTTPPTEFFKIEGRRGGMLESPVTYNAYGLPGASLP